MGISAVLLAYREADNLRQLLPRIRQNLERTGEPFEIIVVDTAEPMDDTESVCQKEGVRYLNQEEPRFGGAFRTGIRAAQQDSFLILDSDGSHDPDKIPEIHRAFRGGADVVIGSRYTRGGKTQDSPISVVMSRLLNRLFRLATGIQAKDISTDFRIYHTNQLQAVTLTNNHYDILQEVLVKLKLNKPDLIIREVPIEFHKRAFGESKRQLIPFVISYAKSLFNLTLYRVASRNYRQAGPQLGQRVTVIRNILLYGLFGTIAAVVDFLLFLIINSILDNRHPEIANVVSAGTGFVVSFLLNTHLNFRKTDRYALRFASYLAICLAGIGLSTAMIYLLKGSIPLVPLKILTMVVVAAVQFLLNRSITYRE